MYNGKSACPVPGPRHDFGCPINFWQSNCYEKQSNDQNYLGGLERTRGFAILPTQTCTFEPFGFYSGEIKNWRNWSDNQNDLGGLRVGTRIYHYIQANVYIWTILSDEKLNEEMIGQMPTAPSVVNLWPKCLFVGTYAQKPCNVESADGACFDWSWYCIYAYVRANKHFYVISKKSFRLA